MRRLLPFAVFGAVSIACATAKPLEERTSSIASLRAAERVGADEVPNASLYLQLAREQSARAEVLMQSGKHREAQRLFQRAEADAELALALAQEEPLRQDAQRLREQLRALGHP
jgi:hypothetical protein